jgi:hypothetical protein
VSGAASAMDVASVLASPDASRPGEASTTSWPSCADASFGVSGEGLLLHAAVAASETAIPKAHTEPACFIGSRLLSSPLWHARSRRRRREPAAHVLFETRAGTRVTKSETLERLPERLSERLGTLERLPERLSERLGTLEPLPERLSERFGTLEPLPERLSERFGTLEPLPQRLSERFGTLEPLPQRLSEEGETLELPVGGFGGWLGDLDAFSEARSRTTVHITRRVSGVSVIAASFS